jgi:hypothetical protein
MAVQSTSSNVSSFPLRSIDTEKQALETVPCRRRRPPVTPPEHAPSRLQSVQIAVTKAFVAPSEAARVVRGDLQARGMWFQGPAAPGAAAAVVPGPTGAMGGAVGGLLVGAILGAGLITIGTLVHRRHEEFAAIDDRDGDWMIGAGAGFAPLLGAIMLGANGALGGGPVGGAATGAALGLIIGSGLITIGALAHRGHEEFAAIGDKNGDWMIGSGAGFSPLAGAILGSIVGVL